MTLVRPEASDAAHTIKLNTVLYHFYAKTAAIARESRTIANVGPVKHDKWFSLTLGEINSTRDTLRAWKTPTDPSTPKLCIDVRLNTSALQSDQLLVGCVPQGNGSRVIEIADRGAPNVLLERWTVDLEYVSRHSHRPANHEVTLPALYKSAIAHFRILYALARALPAHKLRKNSAMGLSESGLQIEVEVMDSNDSAELGPDPKTWQMEGIPTPIGTLRSCIQYRACTELRIERRGTAAPCVEARIPVQPAVTATPPTSLPSSPGFEDVSMPLEDSTWDTTPLEISSPLLQRMWTRAEPISAPRSAPLTRYRMSNSMEPTSPDGLRTLFQNGNPTRQQVGFSPSSFRSLRMSPHGHFETHMRRRAETVQEETFQGAGGAQPMRIQRYARQPSYRQRSFSRSLGGAADEMSCSARSWTQRIEHRRMMEQGVAKDTSTTPISFSQKSPGGSRLFVNTAATQTPAFALSKPRSISALYSSGSSTAAHASMSSAAPKTPTATSPVDAADDLLEFVQMLDAPQATCRSAPQQYSSSSLTRMPRILPETSPRISLQKLPAQKIDDMLADLAESVQLPAVEQHFGGLNRRESSNSRTIRISSRNRDIDPSNALDIAY
ncbi:autophagy protein 13 [Malassezia yamatoensis]|uniref:Autophagy-related protein 13 n=1 Tax=Malassezia yamatoensis TaxID=253288 RepID=A0AAJ5YR01_9BASI|nr:autophagy protein 13 [Malassezia yamatoensis]